MAGEVGGAGVGGREGVVVEGHEVDEADEQE